MSITDREQPQAKSEEPLHWRGTTADGPGSGLLDKARGSLGTGLLSRKIARRALQRQTAAPAGGTARSGDDTGTAVAVAPVQDTPPLDPPGLDAYPQAEELLTEADGTPGEQTPAPPEGGDSTKKDTSTPAAPTGIATQVSLDRFVTAAKAVESDWTKLDKIKRADKLGDAANAELKAASVPEVGIVLKDLGSENGHLDFTPWNLDLNEARFSKPSITTDEIAPVARTVYHESRHAEQWHRMARLEAGKGKKGAEIASALGIKRSVADDAVTKPLKGTDPVASEAQHWYDSVYGANRSHRGQVLKDLKTDGAALKTKQQANQAAQKKHQELQADKSATDEAKKKAMESWKAAFAEYQAAKTKFDATYALYRELPEEKDAWALGDHVVSTYTKKKP